LVIERDRAVEIAVVGDGYGTSAELLGTLSKGLYFDCAVEQAEVSVEVKVYKIFFVHCSLVGYQASRAVRQFAAAMIFQILFGKTELSIIDAALSVARSALAVYRKL